MIAGFTREQGGLLKPIASLENLRSAIASPTAMVWVDLEAPTAATLRELDQIIDLDDEALNDCIEGEQRPRVDDFGDYLFMVLYGLLGEARETDVAPRKLAVFLGRRYLITIHREPLRTIRSVLARCGKNPTRSFGQGVSSVMQQLIHGMVANYRTVIDDYTSEVEDLEQQAATAQDGSQLITALADMRRCLVEVRRLARSQRELLEPLFEGEYELIPDELEVRFGHIAQEFAQVLDNANGLRERLDGVRDSYHALIAQQTNDTMKVLTIVATITLPMSLVAGIYGMNVPLWPSAENPISLLFALVAMLVAGGGLWLLLRWRRLI